MNKRNKKKLLHIINKFFFSFVPKMFLLCIMTVLYVDFLARQGLEPNFLYLLLSMCTVIWAAFEDFHRKCEECL